MKRFGTFTAMLLLFCHVLFHGNISAAVQNGSIEYCQVLPEDRSCIEKSLEIVFSHGYEPEGTIYPLLDGKSQDRLYYGMVANHKLVFKFVPWMGDYIKQYSYSKMAAQQQLGPKIIYNNEKDMLFVMEFVEGSHLSPSIVEDNDILHQLGQAVYHIHHADVSSQDVFDIFGRIEQVVAWRSEKKIANYMELVGCMPFIHSIKEAIGKRDIAHKPSHNDIHMLNAFYDTDKTIKFIDWGDAGFADPFHDLARISLNFGLSEEQINLFLNSYFKGCFSSVDRAHFFLMQNVVMFMYASFFLGLEAIDSGTQERVLICFKKTFGIEIDGCQTPQDISKNILVVFKERVNSAEFKQMLMLVGQ